MLTREHAAIRRRHHSMQESETSQSLCKLYDLYLSKPNREGWQVWKALFGLIQTVVVFLTVLVAGIALAWTSLTFFLAVGIALGLSRAFELLEVWGETVWVRGLGVVLGIPRMVEILFSSRSRYPYWWYSSYSVLLLLCLLPMPVAYLNQMSAQSTAVFVCSWVVIIASMYLTPAAPPFAVVSASSSLDTIALVKQLAFRISRLRIVSLLDHELLLPASEERFFQARARYHVAKAYYLFRTKGDWKEVFHQLANLARVLIVDAREAPSPPVDFEVSLIVQHEHLLRKTLFVGTSGSEYPLFRDIEKPPKSAILVADADLEVLVWALARYPREVAKSNGFVWCSELVPD